MGIIAQMRAFHKQDRELLQLEISQLVIDTGKKSYMKRPQPELFEKEDGDGEVEDE